jgi:heptosyltransferase-3
VKILILHPGALGDTILSLPAISLLRRRFPHAEIWLAGNADYIPVIAHNWVDRFISLASLPVHRLFSGEVLPEGDATYWRSFDRMISWTGDGRPEFLQKSAQLGPEVLIARWRPDHDEQRHVSRIFVDSLFPWVPRQESVLAVSILPRPEAQDEARGWLQVRGWQGEPIGVLNPGAGNLAKRWPLQKYRRLARTILDTVGHKLLLVEGPAELGLARQLGAGLSTSGVYYAESMPFELLAGLLGQCAYYIGNDSGVAHLAAGLNLPSVVIFGPTKPEWWAPLGKRVQALRDITGCRACADGAAEKHTCLNNIAEDAIAQLIAVLK